MTAFDEARAILATASPPWLYDTNAFRLTGLPVTATRADARRELNRVSIAERLGQPVAPAHGLPPLAPVTPALVTAALDRLRDPLARVLDEFFWFWPATVDGPDPALTALASGDAEKARLVWAQASGDGVAHHNLAVYTHLRALDAQRAPDGAAAPTDWAAVYRLWSAVLDDDAVWGAFEARIAALNEVRLGAGVAEAFRVELPGLLQATAAALVATAVEAGDLLGARSLRAALAGLDGGDVGAAMRTAVEPLLAQVRSLCADADRAVDGDPGSGPEIAGRLVEAAEPTIARIDELLEHGDPVRDGIHDELGQTVLVALLRYDQSFTSESGTRGPGQIPDHRRMRAPLRRVLPLVESAALRERLVENLEIVDQQIAASNCWYCQERPSALESSVTRQMHKVTGSEYVYGGRRVHYLTQTLTIPRCEACAGQHIWQPAVGWIGAAASLAVSIALVVAVGVAGWVIPLGIVAAIVSVVAATRPISNRTYAYPRLAELRADGWVPGAKPS